MENIWFEKERIGNQEDGFRIKTQMVIDLWNSHMKTVSWSGYTEDWVTF